MATQSEASNMDRSPQLPPDESPAAQPQLRTSSPPPQASHQPTPQAPRPQPPTQPQRQDDPTGQRSLILGAISSGHSPALRKLLDNVRCDQKIESYILRLVDATRHPANAGLDLAGYIRYGASPRATIYLLKGARARACLNQRDFIIPEDVKDVAVDILRHRIAINYRAEAAGMTSVKLVEQILAAVEIDSK